MELCARSLPARLFQKILLQAEIRAVNLGSLAKVCIDWRDRIFVFECVESFESLDFLSVRMSLDIQMFESFESRSV